MRKGENRLKFMAFIIIINDKREIYVVNNKNDMIKCYKK